MITRLNITQTHGRWRGCIERQRNGVWVQIGPTEFGISKSEVYRILNARRWGF